MSIEGMWAIYFGDVEAPGAVPNSGVVVLESGKVFGGDSLIAYLGSYTIGGGTLSANARTWTYNPTLAPTTVNAFGRQGVMDVRVILEGRYEADAGARGRVMGEIHEEGAPHKKLPFVMHRISDLP